MPFWTKSDDLIIEIHCYLSCHRHDHCFSFECSIALLKVLDDIPRNISDSIGMSDDRIDLSVTLFRGLYLLGSCSLDLGDKMVDLTHDLLIHLDLHEA